MLSIEPSERLAISSALVAPSAPMQLDARASRAQFVTFAELISCTQHIATRTAIVAVAFVSQHDSHSSLSCVLCAARHALALKPKEARIVAHLKDTAHAHGADSCRGRTSWLFGVAQP